MLPLKYILGALVAVVVIGAVFFGFRLVENTADDAGKSSTSNSTASTQKNSTATVLDMSGQGLTKVTSDIYNQTNVTELILSNNNIKSLPSEMGKMTKVVVFKIDHNILEGSLIGEIRQMSQLEILDVSDNNMTGMPAEIGQLSKLQTLDYSNNKISGLPNELSNLKNNLKEFNLSGNPLSQEQIAKLKIALPNTTIIF